METKQASMGVDDNCPIQPPNSTPRTPSPCASVCPSECVPARAERVKPVREKIVLSWSGGKDSSMAAYHLLTSQKYEIVSLMTTVTEGFDRISMHGVRRELLEAQAASLCRAYAPSCVNYCMRFMACSPTISRSIIRGFMRCLHEAKKSGNIVDGEQSIYETEMHDVKT